ncbi:sigma factor [Dactylosporangium sp. NPDC006015]|uniref:sigma factor n=1 Tax=Dactylosporangium sp. NPDC006015 TaxID=3154576 RepID=UPI0033A6BDF7
MDTLERLDDELAAAARDGDRAAMRELAARFLPLVYSVVGRAADRDLDVDDIVRDAMTSLAAGPVVAREPARVRAWVVTVALRHLTDARAAARRRRLARESRFGGLAERPDPASDFIGLVMLRQALTHEQRDVADATRWLDPSYRDLLSLWWLEVGGHLSRADVAAAVALPVAHVAVRVQRMREQLDTARRVVAALRARPGCPALADLTASWDGRPDPLWRKRIARHLPPCDGRATHGGGRLTPPERLLAPLPLLVPPPRLTPAAATAPSAGVAAGVVIGRGASSGVRRR